MSHAPSVSEIAVTISQVAQSLIQEPRMKRFSAAEKPKDKPVDPYPLMSQYPLDKFVYRGLNTGKSSLTVSSLHCCGVKELYGIQSALFYDDKDEYNKGMTYRKKVNMTPGVFCWLAQKAMLANNSGRHRPFWIYTVARPKDNPIGDETKKLIEENGYGSVIVSEDKYNHNSGNDLRVYIWQVPQDFLEKDLTSHAGIK